MNLPRFPLASAAAAAFALSLVCPAQCDPIWSGDPFPYRGGSIAAMVSWDPDGAGPEPQQLVVAGNGITRWNGAEWIPLPSPGGLARALLVWNGELVAAVGPNVRVLQGSTWSLLGQFARFGDAGSPLCLAVHGGDLIVGGDFDTVNLVSQSPVAAAHVARWNGTAWSPLGSGLPQPVQTAVSFTNLLYVGGAFATGASATNLRSWNGSTWTSVGTWNGAIDTLAVRVGTALTSSFLFAGGAFTTVNGTTAAPRIARYSPSSNTLAGIGTAGGAGATRCRRLLVRGTGLSSYELVAAFEQPGEDKVWRLAGGAWSALGSITGADDAVPGALAYHAGRYTVGLQPGTGTWTPASVQQFDATTGWWQPVLGRGIPGTVYAVCADGAETVIGGSFETISGVPVNHIARGGPDAWAPLGGGLTGGFGVLTIARMPNGDLVAGGDFAFADGVPVGNLARWNGTTWSPLGTGTNGTVYALLPHPNGDLIAAGDFTTIGGVLVNHVARWNGSTWAPLGSGTNARIYGLTRMPNGDVVATGAFTTVGTTAASRIARWTGSTWAPLGGGLGNIGYALAVAPDGDLWVGGAFTSAGGVAANHVARWDGSAWHRANSTTLSDLDAAVHALVVRPDGVVVAGGVESTVGFGIPGIGGTSTVPLVRLDSGTWNALDYSSGVVFALALREDGALLVGGDVEFPPGLHQFAQRTPGCAATAVATGSGCAGAGGLDTLAATTRPWNAATFRARATGLPPLAVSMTVYGFTPLQVPLSIAFAEALPGCDLLVSPDVLGLALPNGGVLEHRGVPGAVAVAGRTDVGPSGRHARPRHRCHGHGGHRDQRPGADGRRALTRGRAGRTPVRSVARSSRRRGGAARAMFAASPAAARRRSPAQVRLMRMLFSCLSALALTASMALAQATLIVPDGAANAQIGTTPNVWPANVVRLQCFYDTSHFTSQLSPVVPITIDRLEFRLANAATTNIVVYGSVHAYLSYSAVDYTTPSTTFANNRTVPMPATPNYNGPVTTLAVSGSSPNDWFVDLPLQVPFTYDPSLGQDLLLELVIWSLPTPNTGNSTSSASNVANHRCNSIRRFGSTTDSTGTQSAFPPVVRFSFQPVANAAFNVTLGEGCYRAYRSFYELFANATNDLSGQTTTLLPNADGGYDVQTAAGGGVVAPTTPGLALGDDQVSTAVTLPFTFDYPGGSTNQVFVDSNGNVLLGATGPSTNAGDVGNLLNSPAPRLAAALTDLLPDGATNAANVHAEVDPGDAGTFLITWNGVPCFGSVTPSTFQIALIDNGTADVVQFRYGVLVNDATTFGGQCLTGFSLGNGAFDPGSVDLTAGPISTDADTPPVGVVALTRPVLDGPWNLRTVDIPPTGLVGVDLFGLADPGIDDLFFLGLPGCGLRSTLDIQNGWIVTGATHDFGLVLPNDPSWNGLIFYTTSAIFTLPPQNAFGAVTANGIAGVLGLQ